MKSKMAAAGKGESNRGARPGPQRLRIAV